MICKVVMYASESAGGKLTCLGPSCLQTAGSRQRGAGEHQVTGGLPSYLPCDRNREGEPAGCFSLPPQQCRGGAEKDNGKEIAKGRIKNDSRKRCTHLR